MKSFAKFTKFSKNVSRIPLISSLKFHSDLIAVSASILPPLPQLLPELLDAVHGQHLLTPLLCEQRPAVRLMFY